MRLLMLFLGALLAGSAPMRGTVRLCLERTMTAESNGYTPQLRSHSSFAGGADRKECRVELDDTLV